MANVLYFKDTQNSQHHCIVTEIPAVPIPTERGEWQTVIGREGQFWVGEGVDDEVTITASLYFSPAETPAQIRAWLSGSGPLYCPDWGFYCTAQVIETPTLTPAPIKDGWNVTVTFSCHPVWFVYPTAAAIEITSKPSSVTCAGLVNAKPLVTVTGSGDITLTIGVWPIEISGLSGSITIDCERMRAYDGDTLLTHKLTVTDGWPILRPTGQTTGVTWTGTVTKVVINPRWRVG